MGHCCRRWTGDSSKMMLLMSQVRSVARALVEVGLSRHHSVAILGSNSPYWVVSHLAAIFAG